MVTLIINPPDLTPGWTHDATDWQILDSLDPINVVWEEKGDTVSKLVKIVDIDLDPEKTYYGRARYVFNKALAEWSDPVKLKLHSLTNLNMDIDIPSIVNTPVVTLDTFDPKNAPNSFLLFRTTPMATNSNATHLDTTWIITDTDGNTMYMLPDNKDNLTTLFYKEGKLIPGKTYVVHAIHRSTSYDVSEPGKLYITVQRIPEIQPVEEKDYVTYGEDFILSLVPRTDVSSIRVKFWKIYDDISTLVIDTTTTNYNIVIPSDKFDPNIEYYLLGIEYTYTNGTTSGMKYFPIHLIGN